MLEWYYYVAYALASCVLFIPMTIVLYIVLGKITRFLGLEDRSE